MEATLETGTLIDFLSGENAMNAKSLIRGGFAVLLSMQFTSCGKSSSSSSSLKGLPPLNFFPPITKVENRGGVPFDVYKNWTMEDWCLAGRRKYLRNPLPAHQQPSTQQLRTSGTIIGAILDSVDRDVYNRNPELPRSADIGPHIKNSRDYITMLYGEYNDYTECHLVFEYTRRDPLIKVARFNLSNASSYSEFGPFYSLKRDEGFLMSDMDDACWGVEVLNSSGHCDPNRPNLSPVISIERLDVFRWMAKSRYQVQVFENHPKVRYADGSPVKHFRFLDDGYDANAKWFTPKLRGINVSKNGHIHTVLTKKKEQRLAQIAALPLAEQTAAKEQELRESGACYLPEFDEKDIGCGWGR